MEDKKKIYRAESRWEKNREEELPTPKKRAEARWEEKQEGRLKKEKKTEARWEEDPDDR